MVMKLILAAALWLTPASQEAQSAATLTDVTGVWVMLIEGHQIGLELDQKADKVEDIMKPQR